MKRLLLALLLITVALAARAQWALFGNTNRGDVYSDPATVRQFGDQVRMRDMYDYKTEQEIAGGKRYLSAIVQTEYDCKDERWRTLSTTAHSGQMGAGEVVYSHVTPDEWGPVPAGSIRQVLWMIACGKK